MSEKKPLLFEVCCGSAEDVIEAAKGGAQRVELNSNLFHGGLTPTLGSLRTVKKHAPGWKTKNRIETMKVHRINKISL